MAMARNVIDGLGRRVVLPDRVDRVVSLVPSLTEWLVAAGVGTRLVGVTDWCVEPAEVTAGLPKVRGTKNPNLAAIRALRPDLVVANAEENRRIDVERLEGTGVAVHVTAPVTVAGAVAELEALAAAVGDLPRAASIGVDLRVALDAAGRRPERTGRRYACAVWRDPWMWVGEGTYAADLLRLAGGVPVVGAARYPKLDPDEVAALGPEVVLLPSEPYPFGPADAEAVAAWSNARGRYCFTSSTSTSRRTFLLSRNPPVSSGAFQFRPQSPRLTSVVAEKAARWPPQGSWPAPWNSRSKVTGRVTSRMVSSPSSCQWFSAAAGRTAVERKVIFGYFSTWKKSDVRRWPSRRSSPVVTVFTSSSICAEDCSGCSAISTLAVNFVKRPRALAIMWRATNSNDEWAGSTVQVPATGTVRPWTWRAATAASVIECSSLRAQRAVP
jgi:ABC-type Fe3+-hydroxamate transport system substrate-binding protein